MAVAVRVIPCLDVDAGRVVKGVNFTALRDAGDPVELATAYDAQGADELTFLDVTASAADRETTYKEVTEFLQEHYGVQCLGRLGFENAYALAMRRDRANDLGIRSIEDLAQHGSSFSIAGDMGFFERREWATVSQLMRSPAWILVGNCSRGRKLHQCTK